MNTGLLFVDLNRASAAAVVSDVRADIDPDILELLTSTGLHDRVIGFMCEAHLAGRNADVNTCTSSSSLRSFLNRARKRMFLSPADMDALTRKVASQT